MEASESVPKRTTVGGAVHVIVPRDMMPQVDEAAYPEMVSFIEQRGVDVLWTDLDPADVRPHQHVIANNARHIEENPSLLSKPILVSEELLILDGHHRWEAHLLARSPMPALVVLAPWGRAVDLLLGFPDSYTLAQVGGTIRD